MSQEAELLAAIYANPEDDSLRVVYMDHLLDRGDPRGEFLELQLREERGTMTDAELRTESILFANAASWVAPEVLRKIQRASIRFERGFLARCELRTSEKPVGSRQPGHPAWRTVHTVIANGRAFGPNRVLLEPELADLRHVQIAPGPFIYEYLASSHAKRVETFAVGWFTTDEDRLARALRDPPGAAALVHLILHLRSTDALRALLEGELVTRLERLSLWGSANWDQQPRELRARVKHVDFEAYWQTRKRFG